MAARPTLSVGIPAYNQGRYIAATLDSLLSQSETPLEIVVSNNWSTDETKDVLLKYAPRVTVIAPPSHLSMMAHWNFLASRLEGEAFTLLSSDDVAEPDFVEVLRRGFSRVAGAVLVRAGYRVIDENDAVLADRLILSARRVARFPGNFLEQIDGPKANFAAFALRREVWKEIGGFPERCHLFGDWGAWLLAAPRGAFVYEPRMISRYRVYTGGQGYIDRIYLAAEDNAYICGELIPGIAREHGMSLGRRYRAGVRARIHDLLLGARHVSVAERRELVSRLAGLATNVGAEGVLRMFLEGRMRRPFRPMAHLKRMIRPLVQALLRP